MAIYIRMSDGHVKVVGESVGSDGLFRFFSRKPRTMGRARGDKGSSRIRRCGRRGLNKDRKWWFSIGRGGMH